MNSSKVSNIMFCGFCKNNGKEYKSHDLKGKDGIIICKEILSTECRFCHKLGHTKKFCTVLQEKIERENNVSFPLNVNEKEKEKKSIVAIEHKYKDMLLLNREKSVVDEITKNNKLNQYANEERLKNKNKEKTEAKQAYELNQRQKKQAFETRQAIRVQKKKDQRGLFVCDMTRLLGYRWFIHIKKHLKMEDLIKTYNLHTEDELHNIRREYKYEEEEEQKRQEWEYEEQLEIWDKENKIKREEEEEFKELQRKKLSPQDFFEWEIDEMMRLDEEFENECGFCGEQSGIYMRSSPPEYVSNYIRTGIQLDPADKTLERSKLKRI